MTNTTLIKYVSAGTVLVAAIAYLAYASMKDGWVSYHLTVDEFAAKADYRSQRVRLAGVVDEQGLVRGAGKLGAEFRLKGERAGVPVSYKGVVPDLFKAGCDVVVEGKVDAAGVFRADVLMTKCASKYDSEGKGHGSQKNPRRSLEAQETNPAS